MPLPYITSDHPQVSNVIPHNSPRLRLGFQALQRIWGTRHRFLESFSPNVLYGRRDRRRFVLEGGERHTTEWRCCRRGSEERGKFGDLGRCEVSYFLAVVDLQSCTKSVGCLVSDAIERCQRLLVETSQVNKNATRYPTHTLAYCKSGKSTPRTCTIF